ncbi:WD repeat and coiled-coil-containing protein isoform X1 [Fukomys damarensis]|uniref:WD repeat and coiled-coil-containing protein isoform X1 n=1 Tax=Fukomys damarensis TaxID=885580 RepID=UPI00053FE665|nr:WD repeat and coiled-coil-containing protein isoform X1 [Fukomys damarensis]XP_010603202.1 WD repeat and coiled-coil-containing protein isoform X1 [Fukomys damarensis]XP_019060175.1 WD repeat and coiled-coil-containing protein isoform X1 [Fukomys damarensis]
MELGKGSLLRTGLNALHQALHPAHGLAWTDGSQVVLTELQLHSGGAEFGDSSVLGQFEHVRRVSWAPPHPAGVPALLAVQHKKHVTVWQLCPTTTGSSKWLMSQTTEIRQSLPVLPQGCVWHPKNTVLTVLTAHDASVFPDVHCDSSRVKVDIGTQGHIHCACWTQDGQRLVVAVGSSLHSYLWDGAQKALRRGSFCPVFSVDSCVCSLRATVDSEVAVTTELPLDKICSLNASEPIDAPTNGEDGLHISPVVGELSSVEEAAASETDCEIPASPSFSDLLDLTHLHFNRPPSEESALLCLRKKDYLTGTGQDSSHLVLVSFGKEADVTRRVAIPGILVPDLIAFNHKTQVVAVASNTCNIILIYSVIPSSMPNIQRILLESDERPKGISFMTDRSLLILVGRQKSPDRTFPPSSESDQYVIRLVVREVMLEDSSVTSHGSQSVDATSSALLNKANGKKLIESLPADFCYQNRELLLAADINSQSAKPRKTLIEEIKSPLSSILDGSVALETLQRPSWAWASLPGHASTPEPPNVPRREDLEEETNQQTKGLEILYRNMTEIQRCLFELRDFLYNGKNSPPVYPPSRDAPSVHIIYQKPGYTGPVERRMVLLCNGKLRLSMIQQMFGLSLIEMLHVLFFADSCWILLSADSEGFIPLTFMASQVLVVRDGSPRRSEVRRASLSHSGDAVPRPEGSGDLTARGRDTPDCP